jgi:hypothetical protein
MAGGCLGILYVALCIVVVVLGRTQIAFIHSPTPTITATSLPHILVHDPSDSISITREDFSSDQRDWGLYYRNGKIQIIQGVLLLQSNLSNELAIGTSKQLAPTSEKYYLQADFSTDVTTQDGYGLIFGASKSSGTYYVFELFPQSKNFGLLKYNAGDWKVLAPYQQTEKMLPFPNTNTLSVYFEKGSIELYINGSPVTKYSETNYLQSKDIGVLVSNSGYRLIVDNLFVVNEK